MTVRMLILVALGSTGRTETESWSNLEWAIHVPSERNGKDIGRLWESTKGTR